MLSQVLSSLRQIRFNICRITISNFPEFCPINPMKPVKMIMSDRTLTLDQLSDVKLLSLFPEMSDYRWTTKMNTGGKYQSESTSSNYDSLSF